MSSLAIDAVGPAILGFEDATKRIASGQPVRIAWDVIGASEVHVDGRSVSHSGTFEVTPTRDESHNLVALGAGCHMSRTLKLVVANPEISRFEANPAQPYQCEEVDLAWNVDVNAEEAQILLDGTPVRSTGKVSSVHERSTIHSLVVRNDVASDSIDIAVDVRPGLRQGTRIAVTRLGRSGNKRPSVVVVEGNGQFGYEGDASKKSIFGKVVGVNATGRGTDRFFEVSLAEPEEGREKLTLQPRGELAACQWAAFMASLYVRRSLVEIGDRDRDRDRSGGDWEGEIGDRGKIE